MGILNVGERWAEAVVVGGRELYGVLNLKGQMDRN